MLFAVHFGQAPNDVSDPFQNDFMLHSVYAMGGLSF